MFGLAVIGYLFLGGVGGGLSFVGGLVGLRHLSGNRCDGVRSNQGNVLGPVFGSATLALFAGALLLLADAGNYQALVNLFFPSKPSMLSFGTWAITIDLALLLTLFIYWQGRMSTNHVAIMSVVHVLALLVGAGVVAYTGLFLASMRAVPFWHTPLIPILFVLSSFSCALVLFAVFSHIVNGESGRSHLAKVATTWDIVVVILELLCACAFVALAYFVPREGSFVVVEQSAYALLQGDTAWLWWGAFFGLGIMGTLFLDIALLRGRKEKPVRIWNTLAPMFCVLCGGWAMRYCIVMAGMHPVLSF